MRSIYLMLAVTFLISSCGTENKIEELQRSGDCREAERLIKEDYSGQAQLYRRAILFIECDNDKDKIMRQLTSHFEQGFTPMWKITDVPKSNRQAMYQQLSFIEFTPTHWSGNFKLSQNKSPEVRARIKQNLELANKRSITQLF